MHVPEQNMHPEFDEPVELLRRMYLNQLLEHTQKTLAGLERDKAKEAFTKIVAGYQRYITLREQADTGANGCMIVYDDEKKKGEKWFKDLDEAFGEDEFSEFRYSTAEIKLLLERIRTLGAVLRIAK